MGTTSPQLLFRVHDELNNLLFCVICNCGCTVKAMQRARQLVGIVVSTFNYTPFDYCCSLKVLPAKALIRISLFSGQRLLNSNLKKIVIGNEREKIEWSWYDTGACFNVFLCQLFVLKNGEKYSPCVPDKASTFFLSMELTQATWFSMETRLKCFSGLKWSGFKLFPHYSFRSPNIVR